MSRMVMKSILLTVSVCLLAACAGCEIYGDMHKEVISDSDLEKVFQENRGDFEKIVQMSDEDSNVMRIAFDFTRVDGKESSSDDSELGFSKERWDAYKTIFRRLRIEKGITRGEDGTIIFLAFTKGVFGSGITKGFMFTKRNTDCDVDSLDDLKRFRGRYFLCKRLELSWYLYLQK
jgi:hypothetical protein